MTSENQLNTFLKLNRPFLKDTSNGILKIIDNNNELLQYSDTKELIWDTSVIQRQYNPTQQQIDSYMDKGDFVHFIKGVTGHKSEHLEFSRFDSMRTILGYLLHDYKDSKNTKAIVFCDEQISDNPEGSVCPK